MNILQYVGNATFILELNHVKILVDPSFLHTTKKIHMGWGLKSRRLIPPSMKFNEIQKIDFILLSHTHIDHWDLTLNQVNDILIITNHRASKKLRKQGFNTISLNQPITLSNIYIESVSAIHGPKLMKPFTGSVTGFFLQANNLKIWISGDTVSHKQLDQDLQRLKPDIAIVNFGDVRYLGIRLTFNAEDGMKTILDTSIKKSIAVHIDDWSHFRTTRKEIKDLFSRNNLEIYLPKPGESIELNNVDT